MWLGSSGSRKVDGYEDDGRERRRRTTTVALCVANGLAHESIKGLARRNWYLPAVRHLRSVNSFAMPLGFGVPKDSSSDYARKPRGTYTANGVEQQDEALTGG
ncbi:uncharacterized protein CCOS01_02788 [Colletotrichum costaricense]|uniref:Uncharacterized protein n=2 Tax=Colletotrichum acutatum species complex TaxID=2707335 RepID=A0AAI9Z9T3_9PEZI|nr:uncharacterized protein CCOS01_02788 [Colletotrichum costaricense]XP_060383381.1 uncharacterized protein CTAM01_06162 [Colletotrichum tamarilloi]KAK1501437.1 hypothetical protein CTAM01_06162 [Colletotrichum tamarilloi]KAK1537468.1 hypothetical protein CCOS01_02788 [Colletotrichum costaricense]